MNPHERLLNQQLRGIFLLHPSHVTAPPDVTAVLPPTKALGLCDKGNNRPSHFVALSHRVADVSVLFHHIAVQSQLVFPQRLKRGSAH